MKRSAVVEEMMVHEGPARVFDCEEDAISAIYNGKIVPGDVVVIRYEGPKGSGMPEMFYTSEAISSDKELGKSIALITDGRFSGATEGASIGYVSPEAALMGPLLIVEQGDIISYDIDKRTIQLELSDEEIQRRLDKAELNINYYTGWLGIYQKAVGSITKGGVLSGNI